MSGWITVRKEYRVAGRELAVIWTLSLFITLLNTVKPLTVDDSVYYLFATHIAENPFDPYGFKAGGIQEANTILAPPVFLYWWATAVKLFGENLFLWKLWLCPINLLFAWTLYSLGRRFAHNMALPFVCMVSLSAAVLPCINLMLDIPAMALVLLAVVWFMRACERDSWALALAAGLVAGFAAQTKYTAFLAPCVMLLFSAHFGKWRLSLVAGSLSALLFLGWEFLMAYNYGDSHFWLGYTQFRAPLTAKILLATPLFGYLGSTTAIGLPLNLLALGWANRVIAPVLVGIFAVFGFVAFPNGPLLDSVRENIGIHPSHSSTGVMFGLIGLTLAGSSAAVAWRLKQFAGSVSVWNWLRSIDGFLGLWLILEILGYFALSPYPATRRLLGIVIIGNLLAFRLAAQSCGQRQRAVWTTVGINALLGLCLFGVDLDLYRGIRNLVHSTAAECRAAAPNARIWSVGNTAFEYFGRQLGIENLFHPDAQVVTGDWIMVDQDLTDQFSRHPIFARSVLQFRRARATPLPIRSQYQYGSIALVHQDQPVIWFDVYRVVAEEKGE